MAAWNRRLAQYQAAEAQYHTAPLRTRIPNLVNEIVRETIPSYPNYPNYAPWYQGQGKATAEKGKGKDGGKAKGKGKEKNKQKPADQYCFAWNRDIKRMQRWLSVGRAVPAGPAVSVRVLRLGRTPAARRTVGICPLSH